MSHNFEGVTFLNRASFYSKMVKIYQVSEGIKIAKAVQEGFEHEFRGKGNYIAYFSKSQVDSVMKSGTPEKNLIFDKDLSKFLLARGLTGLDVVSLEPPYQPPPFDKLKKDEVVAVYNPNLVEFVKGGLYKAKKNHSLKDALLGLILCGD